VRAARFGVGGGQAEAGQRGKAHSVPDRWGMVVSDSGRRKEGSWLG